MRMASDKRCQPQIGIMASCKIIRARPEEKEAAGKELPGGIVQLIAYDYPCTEHVSKGTFEWKFEKGNQLQFVDHQCKPLRDRAGQPLRSCAGWPPSRFQIPDLDPDRGSVVWVQGLDPGPGKDSEVVKVTRTCTDPECRRQLSEEVKFTVARVKFSKSEKQNYGFDDGFEVDDEGKLIQWGGKPPHVSIEIKKETYVQVDIEGGAVGSDFEFICDDETVCQPGQPENKASFDLKLKAPKRDEKAETLLKVRCKIDEKSKECAKRGKTPVHMCSAGRDRREGDGDVFARLYINAYPLTIIKIEVMKVYSKKIKYSEFQDDKNYAETSFVKEVNRKMREAVVKVEITNFKKSNKPENIPHEYPPALQESDTGALFINVGSTPDDREWLKMIDKVFPVTEEGGTVRVIVVNRLYRYYLVECIANAGSKTVSVGHGGDIKSNEKFLLIETKNPPPKKEEVTVEKTEGVFVHFKEPLKNSYSYGAWLAGSLGGISRRTTGHTIAAADLHGESVNVRWVAIHEALHTALKLKDVLFDQSVMHYTGMKDTRLFFHKLKKAYNHAETQSQWEEIPRVEKDGPKENSSGGY